MKVYIYKTRGTIKLFVDGILRAEKEFRNRDARQNILEAYTKAGRLSFVNEAYVEIRHYNHIKRTYISSSTKLVRDAPGTTVAEKWNITPDRPPAIYSNTRLYDQLNEQAS